MPRIGERIENPANGDAVTFIELPRDASARLVVELETAPGGDGPPAHRHPHATERFEVLEGAISIEQDGWREVLATGQTHTVPAGIVHRFLSHERIPARTRVTLTPGGRMAEFLVTYSELARTGRLDPAGKPAPLQLAVTFAELRRDIRPTVAPWPAQLLMQTLLGPVGRARGLKPFYATNQLQTTA